MGPAAGVLGGGEILSYLWGSCIESHMPLLVELGKESPYKGGIEKWWKAGIIALKALQTLVFQKKGSSSMMMRCIENQPRSGSYK